LEYQAKLKITLRKFEIKLLELLGFGLNLHAEADTGQPLRADAMYYYYLEHGPVLCNDSNVDSVPKISGESLIALANNSFQLVSENPQALLELKHLMRFVINHHLGNKKLNSRALFRPIG
jgi:DNA repair protein RecO (recombination protein O)